MSSINHSLHNNYSARASNLGRELKLSAQSGSSIILLRPSTNTPETIVKLIDNGLSVARLNFNHGDHEAQKKIVDNVK